MRQSLLCLSALLASQANVLADYDAAFAALSRAQYGKAYAAFRAGAARGDAHSLFALGYLYEHGSTAEFDADHTWVKVWRRDSWHGREPLERLLHRASRLNPLGDRDLALARKYYQAAAARGDARARYYLACLYLNGWGGPRDAKRAVESYATAARDGSRDAMHVLGVMYLNGSSVKNNDKTALAYLKKAADLGHVGACTDFAWLYLEGRGVERQPAVGVAMYQKAAQEGYPEAQYRLGCLHLEGKVVPKDLALGLAWLDLACEGLHGMAMRKRRDASAAMTREELIRSNRIKRQLHRVK